MAPAARLFGTADAFFIMSANLIISDITQLASRYALLIDRGKIAELAELFVEEAILTTPTWEAQGRAAIIARLSAAADPTQARPLFIRHHVTSVAIETQDERTASGHAYYLVVTNLGLDHAGIYVDQYRRLDRGWRINRREVRLDWATPASLLAPARP